MRKTNNGLSVLYGWLLVLGAWAAVSYLFKVNTALLPAPHAVFASLGDIFHSNGFTADLGSTLARALAGYLIAAVLGIVVGLLLGSFPFLYRMLCSPLDFFRSTPVTALYPMFVLFLGVQDMSKIAMTAWACFFVVAINSAYGVFHSNPVRTQMARLYGCSSWQTLRWVTFYEALPSIVVGLKVALSYALIVTVVCEMFMGSHYGLGQKINDSYTMYDMPKLFGYVFITGMVGYLANLIFAYFERRLLPWVKTLSSI
jgi:NitT/TauT family transport system permease protein